MKNEARDIHAAARTRLTNCIGNMVDQIAMRKGDADLRAHLDNLLLEFAAIVGAYHEAGILKSDEALAWGREWHAARKCEDVDMASLCDDCGAKIPADGDVAKILNGPDGEGLCLCHYCHRRTTAPCTTADAERGWDGHGDFEDTPAFMRGHPPELD